MSTVSYWLAEPTEPLPATAVDGRVDVAVVGAGITGCSCALTLADASASLSRVRRGYMHQGV
jgi:heterodisulfide reductase subunit A-like polyferredoxin